MRNQIEKTEGKPFLKQLFFCMPCSLYLGFIALLWPLFYIDLLKMKAAPRYNSRPVRATFDRLMLVAIVFFIILLIIIIFRQTKGKIILRLAVTFVSIWSGGLVLSLLYAIPPLRSGLGFLFEEGIDFLASIYHAVEGTLEAIIFVALLLFIMRFFAVFVGGNSSG